MTLYLTQPHTVPRALAQGYTPADPPPCCILSDWLRQARSETPAAELRVKLMTGQAVDFAGGKLEWREE